jgi:glycerol-3-phosphate dehydrogenase
MVSQAGEISNASHRSRSSSLNEQRRAHEIDELRDRGRVDVLVIGGGVTGCGVALDAAARGLSVALVEKHDLAFGTSRWSSKLVHGGLRYLATGNVGIARESAAERHILLTRTAPHLARPLPQLIPLLPGLTKAQAAVARAGLAAGDLLRRGAGTSGHVLPRSRRVTRAEAARYAPMLRTTGLRGGLLGWDGQLVDDARLVVALARTAAAHGARVLTRCAAEQVTGDGAVMRDRLTGESFDLTARAVVNATGVWADQLAPGVRLRPSRGSHVVVGRRSFGGLSAGLMIPVPGELNRFVFALPAGGRVYIGLTDEEQPGPVPDVPLATEHEVAFLLDTVNTVLREPLTRADVLGSFAGLRPLLDTGGGHSADVSRRHAVLTAPDGLVTVIGGKLTTYRRMAQDAVDTVLRDRGIAAPPCRTGRLPLVGAGPTPAVAVPDTLLRRYGAEAATVLAEAGADPGLLRPLAPDVDVSMAELLFAVRHEGALDAGDLLDRRTRIGLVPGTRERMLPHAEQALAQG